MARKRRRSFGLVRHSSKKMSARYWERYHRGSGGQEKRHMNAHIMVERASVPTNTGRRHGFFATACFGGSKARVKYKSCGAMQFGRTPTIAAKRALVALGRKRDLR